MHRLFKPVDVDQPLDLGPEPTDRYDPHNLWWRHELLHRRCLADPDQLLTLFAHERDETERRWLAERPESSAAFAEADRLLERWSDAVWQASTADTRPSWVRRYWRVRNERAGLPDHLATNREGNVS